MPIITSLLKAKFEIPDDQISRLDELDRRMSEEFKGTLAREVKVSV
jgi:V/A-type H+/Na+-transporting ATPase subunit A